MTFGRHSIEELQQQNASRRAANLLALATPTRALARGTYKGTVANPAAPVRQKIERKARQDIRDSARGEDCTVRIVGVCNFNHETTVWSHYPGNDAGKGMGTKSLDLAGAYCCSDCHDVVDGRKPHPLGMTRDSVMLDWFKGHLRSLVRLTEKGLL